VAKNASASASANANAIRNGNIVDGESYKAATYWRVLISPIQLPPSALHARFGKGHKFLSTRLGDPLTGPFIGLSLLHPPNVGVQLRVARLIQGPVLHPSFKEEDYHEVRCAKVGAQEELSFGLHLGKMVFQESVLYLQLRVRDWIFVNTIYCLDTENVVQVNYCPISDIGNAQVE